MERRSARLFEGEALGYPLLVSPVHDEDPAEAKMIRRHGGVQALGSGIASAVEHQQPRPVRRQSLGVNEPFGAGHLHGGEWSILGGD